MSTKVKAGWALVAGGLLFFLLGFVVPLIGWFVALPGGAAMMVIGGLMVHGGRDALGSA